jgi:hypothetical protein
MSTEAAKHLLDKFSLHILVVLSMGLGGVVWDDIRDTLKTVQLIQFQQIRDGKDIERQSREIDRLRMDVDGLKDIRRGKKASDWAGGFYQIMGAP